MEIMEEHLKCVFNRVKLYFYWTFQQRNVWLEQNHA